MSTGQTQAGLGRENVDVGKLPPIFAEFNISWSFWASYAKTSPFLALISDATWT